MRRPSRRARERIQSLPCTRVLGLRAPGGVAGAGTSSRGKLLDKGTEAAEKSCDSGTDSQDGVSQFCRCCGDYVQQYDEGDPENQTMRAGEHERPLLVGRYEPMNTRSLFIRDSPAEDRQGKPWLVGFTYEMADALYCDLAKISRPSWCGILWLLGFCLRTGRRSSVANRSCDFSPSDQLGSRVSTMISLQRMHVLNAYRQALEKAKRALRCASRWLTATPGSTPGAFPS